MSMLVLPIKKKWFDMIASGEKKEEYREINRRIKLKIENEKNVDTQLKVLHELLDESEE